MHVTATDAEASAAAIGLGQAAPVVGRPVRPRATRPALLLAVFFASLYLLTMGGHLDSPDEELMFQVTRSLAERGSLDIGSTASPEHLALAGLDGRTYTPYGPVSSVLSVPFYALGQGMAALLPHRYSEVVLRFAIGLRDPLVSALECVLVYVLALELGFGLSVAALVSLAFGASTLVWPFAKYSWSEPVTGACLLLSVIAARRAVRSEGLGWSALSGLAVGLAIGSKIATGVVLPALLLYLVGAGHGTLGQRLRRAVPFGAILLLPMLGLALLNLARFGNPLETGYHLDAVIDLGRPIGMAGLLLSPDKSVFLYAPIAVLGVVGLGVLARRWPWEAGLFVLLVASHVLVYGTLAIWHGDAAWGPRYLVPVVPYLVVPAGAALAWTHGQTRRLAWRSGAVLVALGVLVNLGGVLVDQRVSFVTLLNAAGGNLAVMDAQRWRPDLSAVVIQWAEFGQRWSAFVASLGEPASLESGTYAKEGVEPVDAPVADQSPLWPRWTSGDAILQVRTHGQPTQLRLAYTDNRPAAIGEADVQIVVDGVPLPARAVRHSEASQPLPDGRWPLVVEADLDAASNGRGPDALTVEIRSQPWQPARDAPPSTDIRQLGVLIWDLGVRSNGQELPIRAAVLGRMPVSDGQPWSFELMSWFYTQPHVADVWLWYLYVSGLPRWLMLLGLIPLAGLGWSGVRLWSLLARREPRVS